MDFFERQEQARKSSARLLPMLLLAVAGVIPAVYFLTWIVLTLASMFLRFWRSAFAEAYGGTGERVFTVQLWQPQLLLWVSVATLTVIVCGSLYKIWQLMGGGRVVALALGGTRVNPGTADSDERRLVNVVEEMAIASGTPVPDIYILKKEPGLNAFVAGHTVQDMVVTVTEGCVKYLSRDELTGVIAHEYSHLLNGDMRINMRLMGLVHGLFSITLLSYWVMDQTYDSHEREVQTGEVGLPPTIFRIICDLFIMVIGFILAFIGFNGALFGRMVKSAVSRQREFLADAAAVQFTRNPEGLAGALKKAKIWPEGSVIQSPRAEEGSHMFFNDGMDEDHGTLTATHPPLEERIKRVEMMMGHSYMPEVKMPPAEELKDAAPTPAPVRQDVFREAPLPEVQRRTPGAPSIAPEKVLAQTGVPTGEHVAYAAQFIAGLPETTAQAAREPLGASAVVCGLLLSRAEPIRNAQLEMVRVKAGDEVVARLQVLLAQLDELEEAGKIPLMELSLPALRRLEAAQYEKLMQTVQVLILADQQVDLFELALHNMLRRHLTPQFKPTSAPEIQVHALQGVRYDCSVLLSALAHAGQESAERAQEAFDKGVKTFNQVNLEFKFMPRGDCSVNMIDAALNHIAEAGPRLKKQILGACVQTVAADGLIKPREAELLRAVADALDCPIPPFAGEV